MEQVIREESLAQVRTWDRMRRRPDDTVRLCAVPSALLVLFIVIPLVALVWRAMADQAFWPSMTKPVVVAACWGPWTTCPAPLVVSLATGPPVAYLLGRRQFPGKGLREPITDTPLVPPPVTAGVALLMAFGRRGVLGPQLA